ncbi:MAG: hypothetical protein C5B51_27980 [Terriglobia bacterium]|nr:MAG: hypothetical protein C5B51_27980 [Terriglobia bacterium]
MPAKTLALAAALSAAPGLVYAQFDFHVHGRDVQVHSFASQGFAYSNHNNYVTMNTSQGSFRLTDFGFNASTQLTDKLRVGAQLYDYNLGQLGKWHPSLDWGLVDYRFKDWFGVRGGKVKTVVGLYNDTQDMEFLHTWALMPQSVYPLDVRGDSIAHIGGDLYGNVPVRKIGTFSYTVYGGKRPNDPDGGYLFGLSTSSRVTLPNGTFIYVTSSTKSITHYSGPVFGADLRWTTPVKGLLVGASYMKQDITTTGQYVKPTTIPYRLVTLKDPMIAFYVEYTLGNLRFAGEYRREIKTGVFNAPTGILIPGNENARSGYVSAAYRISKWLEVGAYHSRFIANWSLYHGDPMNHVFDQAVTARVDMTRYLDFKVEGHFVDGAMINSVLDRGFYAAPNPGGLKPTMNMLVMRLGYHL